MNRKLKRLLPILIAIVVICSVIWYLAVYDKDFTRDMLLTQARYFEEKGSHTISTWLYNQAYRCSDNSEQVAIELAEQFKAAGNYTKAEYTLSKAIADGGSADLYVALCKTYVEQDKLLDAVTMLDNITDIAIREEIYAERPPAPTVSPDPGFYNQYITVTVSCEGGDLYLTTNGEYPTTASGPSDGLVTLTGGENTIYALCVGENGLVSNFTIYSYIVSGVIEPVELMDSVVDATVREILNYDADRTIYTSDLWGITDLVLPEGVETYEDLSLFTHLQTLSITTSNGDSLQSIANLSHLTEVSVIRSTLSAADLAVIGSLPNLTSLTLSDCGISMIDELAGLTCLTYLDLSSNSIKELSPLSFMTDLTYLDLSHNALSSLNAISSLDTLTYLDISYNSLSSLTPIAGCTALTELNVSNNTLTDLSGIEAMADLTTFYASYNDLTDVSALSECLAVSRLDISNNALTDISAVSQLIDLEFFDFSHNQVTELPKWSYDNKLVSIDGSYNALTSVSSLAGYIHLNYVLMDYNEITYIKDLRYCSVLVKVSVYGNPVKDAKSLTDLKVIVNYNPLKS